MIGMQYKHQELSGRSSSWHKAGRSSRFAESGVRTGSGAIAPGRSPEQRGGEQKKTMISGSKVQFKREAEQKKKGGVKRCLCANKGKPD